MSWNGRDAACPTVVAASAGVAGADGGELGSGGRSSDGVGFGATVHGRMNGCVLHASGEVWGTVPCSEVRCGGPGRDDEEPRRR